MVNNFNQISSLLRFQSEDDFYFLQILLRKKEHPELGSNSYLFKTYNIYSTEYLLHKEQEIISLCTTFNARACINLNRRSFEKTSLHLLRKVTDQILNKDFKSSRKAYDSVCGTYSNEDNKKWVVDIDIKGEEGLNRVQELKTILCNIQPMGDKLNSIIETKNGYHMITSPFDILHARKAGLTEDIHKDNPTALFIP